MMQQAGSNASIPDEIFAKKNSQCMDTIMSKTFVADISKVLHHPAAIGGTYLADCYDRGTYPPTSLGMQDIDVPLNVIRVLLISLLW